MLSPEESRVALRKLFHQRRVANLSDLFKALQTDSPMSVFRRLSSLGYLTSYSHNGRFYTLDEIPDFDAGGLWQCQGVLFSRHGTLKSTTAHLVEVADAGRTHQELEAMLRVRVHNTLLDLVKGKRIGRELLHGLFLYVSADNTHAAVQIARRQELGRVASQAGRKAGLPLVIEILLEIIHGAQLVSDPVEVTGRLRARGVEVSDDQVVAIFQEHGLKKTPARRSRSSRH